MNQTEPKDQQKNIQIADCPSVLMKNLRQKLLMTQRSKVIYQYCYFFVKASVNKLSVGWISIMSTFEQQKQTLE